MLGKLIKYEWKSVYKVGSIMLLAILAVTLIGCIVLGMPWIGEWIANENTLNELQSVGLVYTLFASFILYVIMLVGITYGILIYLGVHFYKTMYTDQGYLTNTLPVTPNQLLVSKIFVSGIWYILIEVGVVLSIVALIASFVGGVFSAQGYTLSEMMTSFFDELAIVMGSEAGGFLIHYMVFLVLSVVLSPFCAMIMLFGSITIGQLSKKYKAMMGILAYFGVMVVNMIISMVVQSIYTFNMTASALQNPGGVGTMDMMGIYDSSLIIIAVMAAVLYWISHYILSKRLNMD